MPNDAALSGEQRIADAFGKALATRQAALMPYFTLGYPDRETSLRIIEAIAPSSDLLELGVPFSDPLADGPTIQHSTQTALARGTTSADCLQMVRELRHRGVEAPFLLMGYYNPILAYGEARFVRDAADAGVDGFIVPDLPFEEAHALDRMAEEAGLVLVQMIAPTSDARRVKNMARQARGFLYLVSLTGVTGARSRIATGLAPFVASVREQTDTPLAVGFGIGTPQQAAEVASLADGIIVGSALIDAVDGAPGNEAVAAAEFVQSLRAALEADDHEGG